MSRKFELRKYLGNRSFLEYSPKKFWTERIGGRNDTESYVSWFKDIVLLLKKNKCKNIIEIGCGTGTNLGYIKKKMPKIDCNGFNPANSNLVADIALGKTLYKNINIYQANNTKELSQIKDKSFDCVLCAGILMHTRPKEIETVVKEIKRISNKIIFTYEQDKRTEIGLRHPNNFVFYHNYKELFKDLTKVFEKEYKKKHYGNGYLTK